VLSPFMYQQILYFALGGWLVFGHVPSALVAAGVALIVGSGLYLLLRELRS